MEIHRQSLHHQWPCPMQLLNYFHFILYFLFFVAGVSR